MFGNKGHNTNAMNTKTILGVVATGALLSAGFVYALVLSGLPVLISLASLYGVSFVCLLAMQRSACEAVETGEACDVGEDRRRDEVALPVTQSTVASEGARARHFFNKPSGEVAFDTA